MNMLMEGADARDSQISNLRALTSALESLRHQTGETEWTMAQILILSALGIKGELAQAEVTALTQLSGSAVSRILFDQLGENAPKGLRLLTVRNDPDDRRRKIIGLTKAGKEAVEALVSPIQRKLTNVPSANTAIKR